MACPSHGWAQHITVDGSLSPAQTLVGPNYAIGAALGRQVGGNLFHSFGLFSLSTGESANFTGPGTVSNIIARVTGGASSSINGTIISSIAGSNLFLINPAGVVFGPNAQLNVSGAFHATTADYLRLTDGAMFQATNPSGSTFSSAAPQAFGFLAGNSGAAISVNGATLTAATGTQLSLVGGAGGVSLNGAALSAPSGVIHVASVAGAGEIGVNPADQASLTATSFGPVSVTNGSTIDTSGTPAGTVYLRGGALTVDASTVTSNHDGAGSGGGISIVGTDSVAITSGAVVAVNNSGSGTPGNIAIQGGTVEANDFSLVTSDTLGSGPGANITVSGTDMTLTNGAEVLSSTSSTTGGRGGDVAVVSTGSVMIDGTGAADFGINTGFASVVQPGASGNAGNVSVTVASLLTVNEGGAIASETAGAGNAGSVTVTAGSIATDDALAPIFGGIFTAVDDPFDFFFLGAGDTATGSTGNLTVDAGQITITGSALIATLGFGDGQPGNVIINGSTPSGNISVDGSSTPFGFTGIFSIGFGPADTGSVTVHGHQINLVGEGEISTQAYGSGNLGNIAVTADSILVDASAVGGLLTGINTLFFSAGTGGGNITVNAGQVTVTGQGQISSSTSTDGAAGDVTVTATSLTVQDGGAVSSSTAVGATGNAGSVNVTASTIAITTTGTINSDTFSDGNAGQVNVSAGALSIAGAGEGGRTGIGSDAEAGSTGNAGAVNVSAGSIALASNGSITSTTFSSGAGGQIAVSAGSITADGIAALAGLATGIASNSEASASGNGGSVSVHAGSITLQNGATVASASRGTGDGGNVTVTASGSITIQGSNASGAAAITAAAIGTGVAGTIEIISDSLSLLDGGLISTRSVAGGGGDLSIIAKRLVYLTHSQITTSVSGGLGNGGNITIDPPFIILDASKIIAQAFGGNGGNISITAAQLIVSPDSLISASSKLGVSGTVVLDAPGTDVTESLAELSGKVSDLPHLTAAACAAAAAAEKNSSLTKGSAGGLPPNADGPQTANYFLDHSAVHAERENAHLEVASAERAPRCR